MLATYLLQHGCHASGSYHRAVVTSGINDPFELSQFFLCPSYCPLTSPLAYELSPEVAPMEEKIFFKKSQHQKVIPKQWSQRCFKDSNSFAFFLSLAIMVYFAFSSLAQSSPMVPPYPLIFTISFL